MHSYVDFLLNVTFKTYTIVLIRLLLEFYTILSFFWQPSWILAAILNSLYGHNGTKCYLSCLLYIKCSPLRILIFI